MGRFKNNEANPHKSHFYKGVEKKKEEENPLLVLLLQRGRKKIKIRIKNSPLLKRGRRGDFKLKESEKKRMDVCKSH